MKEITQIQKGFIPLSIVIIVFVVAASGIGYGAIEYHKTLNTIREVKQLTKEEKYNDAIEKLELAQNKWLTKNLGIQKQEIINEIEKNEKLLEDKTEYTQGIEEFNKENWEKAKELLSKVSEFSPYYQDAKSQIEETQKKITEKEIAEAVGKATEETKKKAEEAQKKIEEEKIKIDTTNWKTYRNEEYGYEIKYPPSFSTTNTWAGIPMGNVQISFIKGQEPYYFIHVFDVLEYGGYYTDGYGPWKGEIRSIYLLPLNEYLQAEYWERGSIVPPPVTSIKMGGIDGFMVLERLKPIQVTPASCVKRNDIIYCFNRYYERGSIAEYNTMLSTFKFVGEEDESFDWENYGDEKIGIEFKCPKHAPPINCMKVVNLFPYSCSYSTFLESGSCSPGEKAIINDTIYCLYKSYSSYEYQTIKNGKCFRIYFSIDYMAPTLLCSGAPEDEAYKTCKHNQEMIPAIIDQMLSTIKFLE